MRSRDELDGPMTTRKYLQHQIAGHKRASKTLLCLAFLGCMIFGLLVTVLILEQDALNDIYDNYNDWQKKRENKFAELVAEKVVLMLGGNNSLAARQ